MAKTRCIILTNGDAARIQEYLSLDMNKKHVQKKREYDFPFRTIPGRVFRTFDLLRRTVGSVLCRSNSV